MDRVTTREDASARTEAAPAMRPISPPYQDAVDDEIRPIAREHRAGSWQSDDTCVRADEGLMQNKGDGSSAVDFDLEDVDSYPTRPRRRRPWMKFAILCGATLMAMLLALDILLRVSRLTWLEEKAEANNDFSRWGKHGSGTENLAWYPTNFLQDVTPRPIHSHNDYWRKVPLFTALEQGCMSVEADVWLFDEPQKNDTLYVGHDRAALQPGRTFQSLYIQPIVEMLERQNPRTGLYHGHSRGVFDTNPNQTLTLLVDVKTAGPATWAKVVEQLAPLRERGWLTYYANGTVHPRAVTVVGSGNTPFAELVANETYRDYFYDAPLNKLGNARNSSGGGGGLGGSNHTYDATNSFYASVNFGAAIGTLWMGGVGAEQLARIRAQVAQAHEAGLKVRYWDLPSWPVSTRDRVWDLLVREGVDMLNVDDVKAAAHRRWKY